jgi:hypothetical protein
MLHIDRLEEPSSRDEKALVDIRGEAPLVGRKLVVGGAFFLQNLHQEEEHHVQVTFYHNSNNIKNQGLFLDHKRDKI